MASMGGGGVGRRARRGAVAVILVAGAVLALPVGPASAATIHVNCFAEDLQPSIVAAAPGSTLLIKGTCYGNFTVDKKLTLKGDPTATLDGNGADTTLVVSSLDPVHLSQLVITGGTAGIKHTNGLASAGLLVLDRVTVRDNAAVLSPGSSAVGGGIFSRGSLRLTHSSVLHNLVRVTNFSQGAEAFGGGIYSEGPLTLIDSVVSSNRASATTSSSGADTHAEAGGGGIAVKGSSLTVTSSHIDGNRVTATSAHGTATARGGGIWFDVLSSPSSVSIEDSTVDGNFVAASGVPAVAGGGGFVTTKSVDTIAVTRSTLLGNQVFGSGSGAAALIFGGGLGVGTEGGLTVQSSRIVGSRLIARSDVDVVASGVGLYSEGAVSVVSSSISSGRADLHATRFVTATGGGIDHPALDESLHVTRSTVSGNRLTLRSDTASVSGGGGGIHSVGPATIVASTLSGNTISATAGGTSPADAFGGGLRLADGTGHALRNSTIAGNAARAFAPGGTATATGGGIEFDAGAANIVDATIARNLVGGSGSVDSQHGGGLNVESGPVTLKATIVALNTSSGAGPDCSGVVGSSGHNLLGHTAGCTFAHMASDKRNVNPKLGLLANNGGPTKTLALLVGSPAINAIPAAACAVSQDQRGVHRPQGPRCDIGAYERKL
jgi:hypothetical protein